MKREMVLGKSQQGILKTRMAMDQQRAETFMQLKENIICGLSEKNCPDWHLL